MHHNGSVLTEHFEPTGKLNEFAILRGGVVPLLNFLRNMTIL